MFVAISISFMTVLRFRILPIKFEMIIDNVEYSEIKPKSALKKLDRNPSLQGGYSLLYENVVAVDLKYIDYDRNVKHVGSNERVNIRIFNFGKKPNTTQFKIQIDSPSDPFFNVVFECDQNKFNHMRAQQGLNNDFQDFATIIIKCLNRIEEEQGRLSAGLVVGSDGKSKFSICQTSQFKNIEVIHLELSQENDDNLQEKIGHKYRALRKKIFLTEERLMKINQIIREKNPSLLLQIQKSVQEK